MEIKNTKPKVFVEEGLYTYRGNWSFNDQYGIFMFRLSKDCDSFEGAWEPLDNSCDDLFQEYGGRKEFIEEDHPNKGYVNGIFSSFIF